MLDKSTQGNRILLGLDFAYGYPSGFADAIGLAAAAGEGRWRATWGLLHDLALDPAFGGGDENNRMDKWAIANELNSRFNQTQNNPVPRVRGPFWGRADWTLMNASLNQLPPNVRNAAPFAVGQRRGMGEDRRNICQQLGIEALAYPFVAMTSPGFPLEMPGGALDRLRQCEQMGHGAQETWHLFGNGTVGGQTITGIPCLYCLLTEPALAGTTQRVWPFETGFADPTVGVQGPLVVHAEIFPNAVAVPSVSPPGVPDVNDARQVWTLVDHARNLDIAGQLIAQFTPAAVAALDNQALQQLTDEEGWILFVN